LYVRAGDPRTVGRERDVEVRLRRVLEDDGRAAAHARDLVDVRVIARDEE